MKHIRDTRGTIPLERATTKNETVLRQFLRLLDAEENDVLSKKLRVALRDIITPRQYEMLDEYVCKFVPEQDIAQKYGISPSSVSRTLARGRNNLLKFIYINADVVLALIRSANVDDIERLM